MKNIDRKNDRLPTDMTSTTAGNPSKTSRKEGQDFLFLKGSITKETQPHRQRNFFEFLFVPHYDELSLFTMAYVCILFLIINNPLSQSDFNPGDVKAFVFNVPLFMGVLLFLLGMLLCLYHAFTQRTKTNTEKKLMLIFAAIINGFSGIWGGTYILVENSGWGFSLFPIWNIISGYILMSLLRESYMEERIISDENVSLGQLLTSTVLISGIFYLCYFTFHFNWAATFSICIAWVTNLYKTINSLMFRERVKIIME